MDYTLGDTIYIAFTTRAFATGIPTALAGSPTLEIYENDSTSPIVEGASKLVLTQNFASINGFNLATITATSGNGFEAGKTYHLILKTGTVGGTSVVGEIVGRFTLQAEAIVTLVGTAGAGLTNINLPDQTMNITGDITGNLSGSVGSVTGSVGSVTAEVTADVQKINAVTVLGTGVAGDLWRG